MPHSCCSDCARRTAAWLGGLAREHGARLAAIARREGLSSVDALDVVQDAFLVLLDRPDAEALRDRPADAARVLAVIVRNGARNARRRHHRARPHDEAGDALAADAADPGAALDRAAATTQLATCLSELADVHRRVVTLRVLEELDGAEAARALGLTPGHVAVLLHRARKQLEHCMQAS
ncbi:MAG: sigma-70 family RNA polymerase sigma factor [Deltaproteobacteria bacterium]|nr:sigma-70 family RNA polymerase sigma factor [Deltaproteobacteria bacterium]MCW5806030.1 sigma-70 family RNA polymerase sigma factor [Deltaproteobacteria bacterium]